MKNSKIRRLIFEITSVLRFFTIAIKKPSYFLRKNRLNPFYGRLWSGLYEEYSGIASELYLSEPYFYNMLESRVNDFSMASAFEHKGYLDLFLKSNTVPNVLNHVSGAFYDEDGNVVREKDAYDLITDLDFELVIKRSIGTGGGKSVQIGTPSEIVSFAKEYKNKYFDFVIQPKICQHKDLCKFNPSSLNTIRILTFDVNGIPTPISTVFRIGNGGVVDNSASGGISVGINDNGDFNSFALDHDFNKFNKHPLSNIAFEGNKIPYFEQMKQLVVEKHLLLKSFGLISWDITVDENGNISIIEYNLVWSEINFHQANNGPIFAKYFDSIRF